MSVTHREFLVSAETLNGGLEEIDFRNAASRAYYSAYHACLVIAGHCPKVSQKGVGHHETLILRFKRYPSADPRSKMAHKIAYLLDQARGVRVRADYEINAPFQKRTAETQIHFAKRILGEADAFEKAHVASVSS